MWIGIVQVLRPISNLANLEIWDYYVNENLSCGAAYDFEVAHGDVHGGEEPSQGSQKNPRKSVLMG